MQIFLPQEKSSGRQIERMARRKKDHLLPRSGDLLPSFSHPE